MTKRLAVLVDGDNIGAKHASEIAKIAEQRGTAQILRVYLDAQRGSDWHTVPGFRLVHSGSGKNATDVLLSIDAVALALREGVNSFVIASSDRDFSHIALRLREYGAIVAGVGEAKTPAAFRQACQTFVQIGQTPKIALVQKPICSLSEMDQQIRQVIAEHSKKGRGIVIAALNSEMRSRHGTQIHTTAEKNWRTYLLARPTLYDLDPRGPDAHVRFTPGGFPQQSACVVHDNPADIAGHAGTG